MDNEIIVNDMSLALLLRDTLEKNGNRNPKYSMIDYKKFTLEELSTIKSLKLEGSRFEDISALKYCTNLRELSIVSANAKDINTNLSDEAKYNYLLKKNNIKDFSAIEGLENLEFLTISYDDNLTHLDISNLKNLASLDLDHNPNLIEVKGLESATELSDLTLYGNSISHSFDLPRMVRDGMLSNIELDFDMYPSLRQEYPDIDEFLSEQQRFGVNCKWQENLSNIRTNQISTSRISQMDKKAQEILQSIIEPDYSDIEKVSAIYAYITQNVQYDYESLAAAKGEKNSAYEAAKNDMGDRISTILDRRQSSYNTILQGKGVCEGYTNMMHYLLNSVGVKSKTVSCSANLDSKVVGANSNHSVIKVEIGDDWYYFDPTWDAQENVLKNFMKTKDEFSKNHVLSMTEDQVKSPETKAYSNAELTQILRKVIADRESEKQNNTKPIENYERSVSSRDGFNTSYYWEQQKQQNINEAHEHNVYHSVKDFDNKTFNYGLEAPSSTTEEYLGYIGDKLGEEYARGMEGEKTELAKQFAALEVKGRFGDFENPYDKGYETSGYDNPKLLLQLEKVSGLSVEEIEDTIGLDTSALHQDIFVATYEIEEWDETLKQDVMKPIKEYYQKDSNGELKIIGTGTEQTTSFTIDGLQIDVDTDQIIQGKSTEKVTQREMGDRLIKNGIEDSMKNINAKGKVTEVAELTDLSFLKDFSKQCGIPENWDLLGRTFIVSTINEKGEEDFDIIIRNDGVGDTDYEHLMGINATEKAGREMYTTNGRQLLGGAKELDRTQTLKEFTTQSGHRYSITRNAEGKLGFNEIFRENENIIQGEHVDTYTFSTDDLFREYENAGINQEDLNNAYQIINRTKAEREQAQNQTKTNNFEGR